MAKRNPEGRELWIGEDVLQGWRTKRFPTEQKACELEVARAFANTLAGEMEAQPTDDEPFDVIITSRTENAVVAGVQLVEAYDDAQRARDAARRRAIDRLCEDRVLRERLDGFQITIRTSTHIDQPGPSAAAQIDVVRALLHGVDWGPGQFAAGDANVVVSGRRTLTRGCLWYRWNGGMLPDPAGIYRRAVESKVAKTYSRSPTPPFWLLVYSFSLPPIALDSMRCRELLGPACPFDEIFLFNAMGTDIYQVSQDYSSERDALEQELSALGLGAGASFSFQLDPSSVLVEGAPTDFIQVPLPPS